MESENAPIAKLTSSSPGFYRNFFSIKIEAVFIVE